MKSSRTNAEIGNPFISCDSLGSLSILKEFLKTGKRILLLKIKNKLITFYQSQEPIEKWSQNQFYGSAEMFNEIRIIE